MRAYSQNSTRALSKRTALFVRRVRARSSTESVVRIQLRARRSSSSSAKETKESFFSLINYTRSSRDSSPFFTAHARSPLLHAESMST
jgi:hypothetical protein